MDEWRREISFTQSNVLENPEFSYSKTIVEFPNYTELMRDSGYPLEPTEADIWPEQALPSKNEQVTPVSIIVGTFGNWLRIFECRILEVL